MSNDLRPCPFCGSHKITHHRDNCGNDRLTSWHFVKCELCGVESHSVDSLESAVRRWNTRHESAKASEQLITGSSKGRTADFESVNLGSSPSPVTTERPDEKPDYQADSAKMVQAIRSGIREGENAVTEFGKAMTIYRKIRPLLMRESVTPEDLQEVLRERFHINGLNGLNLANDLLYVYEIRRKSDGTEDNARRGSNDA